jgi:hypothetical protein
MLARALHESGIPMGQDFPSGVNYVEAKYEAAWVQDINDEILGADRQELSVRVTSALLPRNGISDSITQKMISGIERAQAEYGDWGFKDPRSALTYEFWREQLPEHKLVIIYRSPAEVWKRYSTGPKLSRFRLPFKAWDDYNRSIIKYIKGRDSSQYILLSFERLLSTDEEWDRLSKFVDMNLLDVRDPGQSVNRISGSQREGLAYKALMLSIGRSAAKTYRELEDLRQKSHAGSLSDA